MSFKGFKKTGTTATANHFETIENTDKTTNQIIGRPVIDDYVKQNQRQQFYISQEIIDVLSPIAFQNGCKDVTAYAKKLLVDEFERVKKR